MELKTLAVLPTVMIEITIMKAYQKTTFAQRWFPGEEQRRYKVVTKRDLWSELGTHRWHPLFSQRRCTRV